MTISATSLPPPPASALTTMLGVLANTASNAAQLNTQIEITEVNNQIQNRLNAKIAVLESAPDTAVTNALQTQISGLQKRASTITDVESKYGANANTLADLQNQLATLQTAAANGDGTTFDTALAAANTDVNDLNVIATVAPFQPDQVAALQAKGLGIGNSATYDLTTPAGQAAAATAVQTAQNFVGQVFQATGNNQLLAGSLNTELTTQTGALTTQLNDMQQSDSTDINNQVQALTEQAQNQEHLIELAIGNTQMLSATLMSITESAASRDVTLGSAAKFRRRDRRVPSGAGIDAGDPVAVDVTDARPGAAIRYRPDAAPVHQPQGRRFRRRARPFLLPSPPRWREIPR